MKKKTESKQNNTPKAKGAKPQKMVPFGEAFDAVIEFAAIVIISNDECSELIKPYVKNLSHKETEDYLKLLASCVVYPDVTKKVLAGKFDMVVTLYFADRIRETLGLNKWDEEKA